MPKAIRSTSCTVQRTDGSFCEAPSHEDVPFPICAHHAIKLWRYMSAKLEEASPRNARGQRTVDENGSKAVVYYLQVGELIKIGTSVDLKRRLKDYPPDHTVLALEKGGTGLETYRLKQFSHLLAAKREWFTPGEDLIAHINGLRAQVGKDSLPA